MARVPGLSPSPRDGQQTFARPIRGRAQAPDASQLKPAALQPQAQPVDTYARPERPPESNTLLQLAQTLGDINPSLQRFTQALQPKPADSEAAARAYLQQTPKDEVYAALKSGNTPAPLKNLEGMRVLGEDLAYRDAQSYIQKYNTDFDKNNGDTDELWREVSADTMKQFGKDRAFMEVYTKAADDARRKVMASNMDFKAQEANDRIADANFGSWEGRVQTMMDNGDAGDKIAASLFSDIPKNKQFLQLHPKDQQKQILQIADRLATRGQFEVARSILQFQRKDGAYQGSLLTDRELGDKATDLLTRIGTEEQKFKLKNNASLERENVLQEGDKLVLTGGVNAIRDVEIHDEQGDTKVFTAEQQRDELARRADKLIASEVAYRTKTPEEAAALTNQREKEVYIGNGLENKAWVKTMNLSFSQMSTNALSKDGNIPPTAVDGFNLYKQLYGESPQYLSKYLDGKAVDFFETARVAEEAGIAADDKEAMLGAFRATQDIDKQPEAMKLQYQSIDSAVDSASNDGWIYDTDFGNKGYAKSEIVRTAKYFARMGIDTDKSLEKASEVFKKTHIAVADSWLPNDKRMPPDFKPLIQQHIDELAKKYGDKLHIDPEDLTIDRYGNGFGSWLVVLKGDRQAVHGMDDSDRFINLNLLDSMRKRNRTKTEQEVITKQNNR
jgi:hypothetical protein